MRYYILDSVTHYLRNNDGGAVLKSVKVQNIRGRQSATNSKDKTLEYSIF
jgi:hypothetical protein